MAVIQFINQTLRDGQQSLWGMRMQAGMADLIGGEQRPAGVVLGEAQARPLAVERPAHGLEHDGFLAEQIGDQGGLLAFVSDAFLLRR